MNVTEITALWHGANIGDVDFCRKGLEVERQKLELVNVTMDGRGAV